MTGLLIKENDIVAGESAKAAPTKIETIRRAIFIEEAQKEKMIRAIKRLKPESILILGTSDKMVKEIAENLELPEISKTIYITDVASEEEIKYAREMRTTEGKHVIPVPTFEIKKQFSGYLLDPLQIFQRFGDENKTYVAEKSLIRPTFSYMGRFIISDNVFYEIIEYVASKASSIEKVDRIRLKKDKDEKPSFYIEVTVYYGITILPELKTFKEKCIREIERLTSINVKSMKIIAKKIVFKEN